MGQINLSNVLLSHWIRFDYPTDKSIAVRPPHFLFNIEDSIHYNALTTGDFDIYEELITTTNQKKIEDCCGNLHTIDNFKKLHDTFNLQEVLSSKISVSWDDPLKKLIVQDGCHRLAIIKKKQLDKDGMLSTDYFNLPSLDATNRELLSS